MHAHAPLTEDPLSNSEVFKALADAARQRILQLLLAEELSVSELVSIVEAPQSTVSRHLRALREAGLVVDRRNGTMALYSAAVPASGSGGLQPVLLDWIRAQPIPQNLAERLKHVITTRRDEAVGFFERIGNRWDELRENAFGNAFAMEAFVGLLPRDWTVLDVGAGTGFLLPPLAMHFKRVIAVEPSPAMLGCARQRAEEHGLRNVVFHQGDLGRLPVGDAKCDLAIACLVMHHVVNPAEAISEMHRVLRPAGRILIVEQRMHENRHHHEMMQDYWWGFEPGELERQVAVVGFRNIRHSALATTRGRASVGEAPSLFALFGERMDDKKR
jgi:ArsR family transcriptional regulator